MDFPLSNPTWISGKTFLVINFFKCAVKFYLWVLYFYLYVRPSYCFSFCASLLCLGINAILFYKNGLEASVFCISVLWNKKGTFGIIKPWKVWKELLVKISKMLSCEMLLWKHFYSMEIGLLDFKVNFGKLY